jgi:hypothetical protein
MDKSNWPQAWKDQYNFVITQRARMKRINDEWKCPKIWKFSLTEENVFALLGHCFPFNHVIKNIICRFYQKCNSKSLLVSSKYLYEARKTLPSYYSDRERIVVQLNKYLITGNLDQFVQWLPFYSEKKCSHLIHLMIGVFFLDRYLENLENDSLLKISITHLERGKSSFSTAEAHLVFTSLIAFAHYMNREFEHSLKYLDRSEINEFHRDFGGLIRKVAA